MSEIFEREEEYGNSLGRVNCTGYNGTQWVGLRVDSSTRAVDIIDYEHHEVHAGSHYFLASGYTLANGVTSNLLIVTPDSTKWTHMHLLFTAGLAATFELYEASARTAGTQVVAINSNRNSVNTAGTMFYSTYSSGTTDGTLIASFKVGSASVGGKIGGAGRSEEEIILRQNTQYILRTTSGANANNISTFLTFYEHTDKPLGD